LARLQRPTAFQFRKQIMLSLTVMLKFSVSYTNSCKLISGTVTPVSYHKDVNDT